MHGAPCPHVLSTAKAFKPAETHLAFIERNLKFGPGVDVDAMLRQIKLTDEEIGSRNCVQDLELLYDDANEAVDQKADNERLPCDLDLQSDTAAKTNALPQQYSQEIWITSNRIPTYQTKREEAAQHGKKGLSARRWLLDNVYTPLLKKAAYTPDKFFMILDGIDENQEKYELVHNNFFSSGKKRKRYSSTAWTSTRQNLQASSSSARYFPEGNSEQENLAATVKSSKNIKSKKTRNENKAEKGKKTTRTATPKKATAKAPKTITNASKAQAAGMKKKPSKPKTEPMYEISAFKDCTGSSVLVEWKGFEETSWEPITKVKTDLGFSIFKNLWENIPSELDRNAKKTDDTEDDGDTDSSEDIPLRCVHP